MKKIALFDLDNSLAGFQEEMIKALKLLVAPGEPNIDYDTIFTSLISHSIPEWLENRMYLIKRLPGWWRNLPKLEDGFQVYEACRKIGFDLHILTKGPAKSPEAWTEKLLWCQDNIPQIENRFIDTTITMNKGLVYGNVLVEDWPPYIESWLQWRKRGLVVLLDRPYNQEFHHPQVLRFNGKNLDELNSRLQKEYDRKPEKTDN